MYPPHPACWARRLVNWSPSVRGPDTAVVVFEVHRLVALVLSGDETFHGGFELQSWRLQYVHISYQLPGIYILLPSILATPRDVRTPNKQQYTSLIVYQVQSDTSIRYQVPVLRHVPKHHAPVIIAATQCACRAESVQCTASISTGQSLISDCLIPGVRRPHCYLIRAWCLTITVHGRESAWSFEGKARGLAARSRRRGNFVRCFERRIGFRGAATCSSSTCIRLSANTAAQVGRS